MDKRFIFAGIFSFLLSTAFGQDKDLDHAYQPPSRWSAQTFCTVSVYASLKPGVLKQNFFGNLFLIYHYCDCTVGPVLEAHKLTMDGLDACKRSSHTQDQYFNCLKNSPEPSVEVQNKMKACQPLLDKVNAIIISD